MTFAQQLGAALAATLGPVDPTIHTAIPPLHLGGAADVITFRRAPSIAGVVHVSAGAAEAGMAELVLCMREPSDWAPVLLSRLAAAQRQRRFVVNGTTPLAGPEAPFAGLLFAYPPRLSSMRVGETYTSFLLCVGITAAELAACRSHGTPSVVALLAKAGVYPYSARGRADARGIDALGPSPLERPGLSERARRGLAAVVHGQAQDVEMLRTQFSPGDLEILAATYPALGAFEQRAELVKLTQDSEGAPLIAMWRAFVRDALAAELEAMDAGHMALAIALSSLGGGRSFDAYWDDLDGALTAARAHAARA